MADSMKETVIEDYNIGIYRGLVAENYRVPAFLAEFGRMADIVRGSGCEVISAGRNLNVKVTVGGHELVVKSFGRQFILKDYFDSFGGGKARRTWEAASLLYGKIFGTPFPVAFLERWEGGRLVESYYISEFQPYLKSFGDELLGLYKNEPECDKLMSLLEAVAVAVAKMHRVGLQHNDLGNQNILLHRSNPSTWEKVQFVDLNRASIREKLSERQRARDISRLNLPSDLLRVFKDMYHGGAIPTERFHRWERFYRKFYAVHCATRHVRHPVRWLKKRSEAKKSLYAYPAPRDMWIWDERSGQPINTLRSKDRNSLYPRGQFLRIALAVARGIAGIRREYKALLKQCWLSRVSMKDRIGVAIEPNAENLELELALLNKLGSLPVIIRFYHHKGRKQWDLAADVVGRLARRGRKITVAIVQDRQSAKDAELWEEFVRYVIEKTAGKVEHYELGHAINRVKWGIWDIREYLRMMDVAVKIKEENPDVNFIGPAVIDFEYPFLAAVLRAVPESFKFGALSHHLYVDRRGAPENRQGPYSALEKFVLARAVGRRAGCCGDKLIVSEVNWPLKGTGVYSPVNSPYMSPQPRQNDPSVNESDYADYMLRYLLIAICSGMVERVYWWRLVARGYGLVDDTDPDMWREREAYAVLEYFLRMLGNATFIERDLEIEKENEGVQVFKFETGTGSTVDVIYTLGEKVEFEIPFEFNSVTDVLGVRIKTDDGKLELTGRPVYVYS